MWRVLTGFTVVMAAAIAGGAAARAVADTEWFDSLEERFDGWNSSEGGDGPVADLPRRIEVKLPAVLQRAPVAHTIYLNREGARLFAGTDDASENRSSIVRSVGKQYVDVPAFAGSPARWNAIAKCIRQGFEPYDVRVVEQRPLEPGYMMALMGGTPKLLGKSDKHHHATGLAPFNSKVIPGAVVFVFTRALRERTTSTCNTAAMEIAHAYGLDHSRHCRDFMTYKRNCGRRRFMDDDIACGEGKDRACANGAKTQNSHKHLLGVLGPAMQPAS